MEFFSQLFDTSDFPARWTCGRWSLGHGWLHILSDLGVWSAYFAIPLIFGYFLTRRKDLPFRSIFLLFAAFIVLCGTTHLMEAVIFWWPAYRLAGVLKLLTAVVSWLTVFALVRTAPAILSMRSPEELERLVRERTAEAEAAIAALRAERELLSTTLTSIGDAVISTDVEGRITIMNTVAETLTGWATAEAKGQPLDTVFNIVNEETRRPVENPATRALKEGIIVGLANHTVLVARDGTERPIADSAAPIRSAEGVVGCVLVFRDITERHRQEAELRERERQFVTLAESIPQLAWTANPDGHIFWYNRRWYDYTGTTPEQMEGWGWQSVHDPQELPKVLESWRASIATGQSFDMVFPLRGKDGVFRPFLTRVEPVKDEKGQVVRWFGTNTDVDELEQTRVALRENEEWLRQMAANLSEANRKKDEFLATLAHELRNPLAPIRNGLQVMKLAGDDAEAVERSRSMMERQIEQMVRLVDDLMDVARITSGKVELRRQHVPLATVVSNAVETSRPLIERMGHKLTLTQPKHPIIVDADLTRLAQVFGNLLNNAAKYSEREGHIRLTVVRQGSDVVVSVKDTGIGIPSDKLASVYDMFSQVDRSLEKSQGGLGIGLMLVKRLVEMHDGGIEAKSDGPGKGAEFVVRLPVVVEESGPQAAGDKAELLAPKSSLRILIVDDNKDGADSLTMMLEIMGNETHTAYDGQEGVDVAERVRPDVILFDIGLPKLNGYEACRRIRQQPWGKSMTLVAVTGWGQDEDRRRSHEAGFDHHMVKPVDPKALMKLLAELNVAKQ